MRERSDADDIVQGAYNRALLDLILPAMRNAARDAGYTIAVHGSLNRDVDLVAIPWTEAAGDADALIVSLVGALRGAIGRADCHDKAWTAKPHGRMAKTLLVYVGENYGTLDLSVMPRLGAQ